MATTVTSLAKRALEAARPHGDRIKRCIFIAFVFGVVAVSTLIALYMMISLGFRTSSLLRLPDLTQVEMTTAAPSASTSCGYPTSKLVPRLRRTQRRTTRKWRASAKTALERLDSAVQVFETMLDGYAHLPPLFEFDADNTTRSLVAFTRRLEPPTCRFVASNQDARALRTMYPQCINAGIIETHSLAAVDLQTAFVDTNKPLDFVMAETSSNLLQFFVDHQSATAVCQLDLGLDYSNDATTIEFEDVLAKLLLDARFALINASGDRETRRLRLTYLNIDNAACIRKFMC